MQKRKIVAVAVLLTVVVIAMVAYEFFLANSLSGYTKITLASWSYPPCSVKFGNTSYYIVYFLIGNAFEGMPPINTPPDPYFQITTEQTLIIYQNESFAAIQGAKYSFEGLRIVVGNVNVTSNPLEHPSRLVLYVKSTISNSHPIVSPIATPISPTPTPIPEVPIPVVTPPYIVK